MKDPKKGTGKKPKGSDRRCTIKSHKKRWVNLRNW